MSNYRITNFDSLSFIQANMYTKSGTVGNLKARVKPIYPPHSLPLNPYGSSSAPIAYEEIKTNILLTGDPDDNDSIVQSLRAKVGIYGILTGRAGGSSRTCYAHCVSISGDWDAPFKDGETQWLHLTVSFQPYTEWA